MKAGVGSRGESRVCLLVRAGDEAGNHGNYREASGGKNGVKRLGWGQ